ncbi:hypothetical protein BJY52DRAFT_1229268 [Lactarius psammicola]|nr:hypothetical protein BJY52DRAFT_1229268 [Lactarius psammicola]
MKRTADRFQIWAGCWELALQTPNSTQDAPTVWLRNFFSSKSVELQNDFTHAISSPSTILEEYLAAFKSHNQPHHCNSCFRVHAIEGETFRRELEDELAQAVDKVKLGPAVGQVKDLDTVRQKWWGSCGSNY